MNKRTLLVALLMGLLFLAACAPAAVEEPGSQASSDSDPVEVLVYASPT